MFAFVGKLIAGFMAKGDINEKMFVGLSMVPRGEVGLIFATIGRGLGVLNDQIFSVITIVIILTTLIPPFLIKKYASKIKV